MEQCTLFWVAFAGLAMLTTLIVIGVLCLRKLSDMQEKWDRVRDKFGNMDTHFNKIEAAVEWWLQKEGMMLECSHSLWRWFVRPTDDGKLRDWLTRTDERKREALADALYRSTLQAMRDHDKEKKKK